MVQQLPDEAERMLDAFASFGAIRCNPVRLRVSPKIPTEADKQCPPNAKGEVFRASPLDSLYLGECALRQGCSQKSHLVRCGYLEGKSMLLFDCVTHATSLADLQQVLLLGQLLEMELDRVAVRAG